MENSKKHLLSQSPFNEQFITTLKHSCEVVIQACENGFLSVIDTQKYLQWIQVQFNLYASDDDILFVSGSLMVLEARQMLLEGNLLELQKLCIRIQLIESKQTSPAISAMVVKIFLHTAELHIKNRELAQALIILNESKNILNELENNDTHKNLQSIVNQLELIFKNQLNHRI